MSLQNFTWNTPQAEMVLTDAEVHVWRLPLEIPAVQVVRLGQNLSQDEIFRAGRFHFERDRRRFIAARGQLRIILSQYLKCWPNRIQFSYNIYGKPDLIDDLNPCRLRFNLAHSNELALLAVTSGREVGIDLEYSRPLADAEQIAASVFSETEIEALHGLSSSQKLAGFFNGWTRKEAYIKALGTGLSQPLDEFDVSIVPGEPARLLRVKDLPGEAGRWSIHAFKPDPAYIAALVVEGFDWQFVPLTLSNSTLLKEAGNAEE